MTTTHRILAVAVVIVAATGPLAAQDRWQYEWHPNLALYVGSGFDPRDPFVPFTCFTGVETRRAPGASGAVQAYAISSYQRLTSFLSLDRRISAQMKLAGPTGVTLGSRTESEWNQTFQDEGIIVAVEASATSQAEVLNQPLVLDSARRAVYEAGSYAELVRHCGPEVVVARRLQQRVVVLLRVHHMSEESKQVLKRTTDSKGGFQSLSGTIEGRWSREWTLARRRGTISVEATAFGAQGLSSLARLLEVTFRSADSFDSAMVQVSKAIQDGFPDTTAMPVGFATQPLWRAIGLVSQDVDDPFEEDHLARLEEIGRRMRVTQADEEYHDDLRHEPGVTQFYDLEATSRALRRLSDSLGVVFEACRRATKASWQDDCGPLDTLAAIWRGPDERIRPRLRWEFVRTTRGDDGVVTWGGRIDQPWALDERQLLSALNGGTSVLNPTRGQTPQAPEFLVRGVLHVEAPWIWSVRPLCGETQVGEEYNSMGPVSVLSLRLTRPRRFTQFSGLNDFVSFPFSTLYPPDPGGQFPYPVSRARADFPAYLPEDLADGEVRTGDPFNNVWPHLGDFWLAAVPGAAALGALPAGSELGDQGRCLLSLEVTQAGGRRTRMPLAYVEWKSFSRNPRGWGYAGLYEEPEVSGQGWETTAQDGGLAMWIRGYERYSLPQFWDDATTPWPLLRVMLVPAQPPLLSGPTSLAWITRFQILR